MFGTPTGNPTPISSLEAKCVMRYTMEVYMAEDGVLETQPLLGSIPFREDASVLSGSSSKIGGGAGYCSPGLKICLK